MHSPSEEGPSPKSAEDPEESTGGEAGAEPVEPASRKARRPEENAGVAEAPSSDPGELLPTVPPVVDGIEIDGSFAIAPEPVDDGRGLNRIHVEHPDVDLTKPTESDASRRINRVEVEHPETTLPSPSNEAARGINRLELDHPETHVPEPADNPDRGINRVELEHPDPVPRGDATEFEDRGIRRVQLDAPNDVTSTSVKPVDGARGFNRVEMVEPPLRLPETWSKVKGNATPKRVEIPYELDAILGIKRDDGRVEEANRDPALLTPEDLLSTVDRPPSPPETAPNASATKVPDVKAPRPAQANEGTATTAAVLGAHPRGVAEKSNDTKTVVSSGPTPAPPAIHLNGNGATAPVDTAKQPSAGSSVVQNLEPTQAPPTGDRRKGRWLAWFLGKPPQVEGTVTPIPPLEPGLTEIKLREYQPGISYSRVYFDTQRARHRYALIEPPLDEREKRSLDFVKEVLLRTLDVELEIVERAVADESLALLDERVKKVVRDYRMDLSQTSLKRIIYYLRRDFTGYGPVDVMMHDPDIEDISCDGPGTNVFLYHRRFGSMESNVFFRDSEELDGFVIRMAQRSGKQITIADPLLDSSLPDGSRLQATLGREVTDNGSTFTIRRFRDNPLSPIDLVRMGTMSAELLAYCWIVVQYGANVMLAGGTASGKTTTLNTISLFIPPQAKIVSIEDTREINLPHKNWVRSVTRGGTRGNDVKRVDMFDLLTAALRQRPEYILVGEVRGKEATVAFQAMATGHTVLGTVHADSPRSVVYRLESEPINIPRIVIQSLDVILMQALLNVSGRRQRRIQEVAEIVGIDPASKELLTHGVFVRNPTTDQLHYTGRSYKLQKIATRNSWTAKDLDREMKRRTQIINTLVGMPGVSFADIGQLFSTYENRPDMVDAELEQLRPKETTTEGTN